MVAMSKTILLYLILTLAAICYAKGGVGKPISPCEITRFKYESSIATQTASLAPENQEAGKDIATNLSKELDNCETSPVCFGPYIGLRNRCYALAHASASNQITALTSTTVAP